MRIGIIAALPGELQPLVRGWQRMPVARGSGIAMWQRVRGTGVHGTDEQVAVCGGMGAAAARRAFLAAEHAGSLDAALSVGWAGALSGDVEPGEAYAVGEVVDTQTGERFRSETGGERLVTTLHVAAAGEKLRLAASYAARLVDMEAAAVARLAAMRGIPFGCFKAVSDGIDAELPDLNPFIDINGKLRLAAFLAHLAVRPQFWGPVARLGRTSTHASKQLAATVNQNLENRGAQA